MNIGITGGNGFIGRHIIQQLKTHESVKIFVFELPEQNIFDFNQVKKFVSGKDVIIHAAAVNRGTDDEVISGGVVATHNIIHAVLSMKKKPKIIFLSSMQAGNGTIYGTSKLLSEKLLESIALNKKIFSSVFRIPNVYGEGCRPFYNSVVATFCYQEASGKKLTIHKRNASKWINLIYVNDLAKIIADESFVKRKNPFYFREIKPTDRITIANLAKTIGSFSEIVKIRKDSSRFVKNLFKTYISYKL